MSPPQSAELLRRLAPGTRVVVRYRIPDAGPHRYTDALGELTSADGTACTIATRRGAVVVPFDLVVAAKEVPPAPQRRNPAPPRD